MMCRPPKPSASHTSFHGTLHAAGVNMANAPSIRKQAPITGTTGTEKAPPVTTPVPYSMSQTPGIAVAAPARHNTTVSAAPTASGGTKLNTNLRAGADHIGIPALDALRHIARMPIVTASAPSIIQVTIQASVDVSRTAMKLVITAVTPIATPPHPGTAVN